METVYLLLGVVGFLVVIIAFFFGGFVIFDSVFMGDALMIKRLLTVAFIIVAVISVVAVPFSPNAKLLIIAGFLLGPPIWFRIEYRFFYNPNRDGNLEEFSYKQGLMRDIWVGISAMLAFYYFDVIST